MVLLRTDRAAQQAIDREIAQLEQSIHLLKLKRNTYSAFNRLPNDVISLIFVAFKQNFSLTKKKHAEWTFVLRVCSHWRNILLNTPRFWSAIPFSCPSLVYTMVQNSKMAPIDLYCPFFGQDPWTNAFDEADVVIMSQSTRIQSLTIAFSEDDTDLACVGEFLAGAREYDLASVRSVKLELQRSPKSYWSLYLPDVITIDDDGSLPWAQMPSLSVLSLTEVLVPLDMIPLLPSLTKLVVSCEAAGQGLSVEWITTFLRQTPNIEEVEFAEIVQSHPSDYDTLDSPIAPICLPRLRLITIDAEDLEAIHLFDVLDIPTSTRVHAMWTNYEDSAHRDGVLSSIKKLITRFVPSDQHERPKKLSLCVMGDPNRIGLVAYTEGTEGPSLDMDIPLDHPELTIDDVLQHFRLEALPKMVTELTIRDTYLEDTPTKWFDMVPLFENLKVLNFTYCPPSTLTSVLSNLESKDLEVISFLTIPILPRRRTEDDSEPSPELPLEVFEFFRGREATGFSLPKLIITKCRITRRCVDALRKYVTVDWDGLEDGGEEGMFRHFDPDFAQSLALLDTSD